MKAICERRDEAILMLVHGELRGKEAAVLRAHLLLCPACRERRAQMERATRAFAVALANPRLGIRPIVRPVVWASVGVLAVLLAILGMLVSADVAAAGVSVPKAAPAPTPPAIHSHCDVR